MKVKILTLSEIKEKFYVRIHLDESRVLHFVDLKMAQEELPPLQVGFLNGSDEPILIDGRHRKAADERLGTTESECEIKHYTCKADMIVAALKANVGGSLPPSQEDITHTMELLLASGLPRREIIQKVTERTGFPATLVAKHVRNVQNGLAQTRLRKAVHAVAKGGKTIEEAALEHDVSIERLRAELLKGKQLDENEGVTNLSQAKAWTNKKVGSLNHSLGRLYAKISRDLGDGLLTPKQAEDIMEYMEKMVQRIVSSHDDWKSRILSRHEIRKAVSEREKKDQGERVRLGRQALERMGL